MGLNRTFYDTDDCIKASVVVFSTEAFFLRLFTPRKDISFMPKKQTKQEKHWETFEEVARYLLNQMADRFGLERVEGKQPVTGLRSGATWKIDAKGIKVGEREAFIIIECRRFTTSRQKQEHVAGLAYRILDTQAEGGILVSPLGLQAGAAKIAEAENIISVLLDENSTPTNFIMQFLNNVFFGVEEMHYSEEIKITELKEVTDLGTGSDMINTASLSNYRL